MANLFVYDLKCEIVESLKRHNNLREKILMNVEIRGLPIFFYLLCTPTI